MSRTQFPFLEERQDSIILSVYVRPNSKQEKIIIENDSVTILITDPPIEGRANKIILKILSKILNIPISKIEIIKGNKSHDKKIALNDLNDFQKQNIIKTIQNYKNLKIE